MPAEVIPQPTATSPDKPPRKPRKGAKPPAAPIDLTQGTVDAMSSIVVALKDAFPKKPRAPREKPARTLRVRIAEIGEHHIEAFDLIVKRTPAFAEDVRKALDAKEARNAAEDAVRVAAIAHDKARKAEADATALIDRIGGTLHVLDAKARLVAQLHDDAPESDEDFGPLDPGAVPGDAT